jgi:adenosylmethionine-8-amino-7-oxononanoate aminotransferase
MSAQALIKKGAQIQEQSLASTQRSKRMIEDSRAVGIEASVKLKQQTEQLRNIDEDVMKVRTGHSARAHARKRGVAVSSLYRARLAWLSRPR